MHHCSTVQLTLTRFGRVKEGKCDTLDLRRLPWLALSCSHHRCVLTSGGWLVDE